MRISKNQTVAGWPALEVRTFCKYPPAEPGALRFWPIKGA
jgi:hypothetical protein